MTFRRDVDLDPGRVRDVRGRRVGAGGLAVGGGGVATLIIIALVLLSGGDLGDILGGLPAAPVEGPVGSQLVNECETGADANQRQDCRLVGAVQSLDAYWTDVFAASGQQLAKPGVTIFSQAVTTQCGSATSAVGPFYCPIDQTIYLDLGFFQDLESRFGAQGGPFAEMYVVAHEYGHHIQNLLGFLEQGRDPGAEGGAVRVELQADCLAGLWGGDAVETGFLEPLTREQINQALDAAAAIGDDRIQERMQGQVDPHTWTHGSAEQRQEWLINGLEGGSLADCDTFNADI